jgi:hypothetical protein
MCSSVSVSTLEKQSSRISTGGVLIRPRVNVERCFCPPERDAAFPNGRIEGVGERDDRVAQVGVAGGGPDQRVVAFRIVVTQVVPQQVREQERILRHEHDLVPQLSERKISDVATIDQQRTRRRIE